MHPSVSEQNSPAESPQSPYVGSKNKGELQPETHVYYCKHGLHVVGGDVFMLVKIRGCSHVVKMWVDNEFYLHQEYKSSSTSKKKQFVALGMSSNTRLSHVNRAWHLWTSVKAKHTLNKGKSRHPGTKRSNTSATKGPCCKQLLPASSQGVSHITRAPLSPGHRTFSLLNLPVLFILAHTSFNRTNCTQSDFRVLFLIS